MTDWRVYLTGTHARIDLDGYISNLALLQTMAPQASLMAVVKADAYGHGAIECAQAAVEAGVAWLGVARIDEALLLRRHGVRAPVLVLGPPNPSAIGDAIAMGISLAVGSRLSFDAVVRSAAETELPASVHIKVDTGMHRYGFTPHEVGEIVSRLNAAPNVKVVGVFTHFARADEIDLGPTDEQARIFAGVVERLRTEDHLPEWVHQANSAGILTGRHSGTNLVRAGIASYGLSPSDELAVDERFRPILSLHSAVGRRFALAPGDGVAYGWTYVAEYREEMAVVPVGYADGLPRQLANNGWFVVGGQRAPIRGRVCMDQTIISVNAHIHEGDPVEVYGAGAPMSLEHIGVAAGTNNYEIATRLTARVPRIYYRRGAPDVWEMRLLGMRGRCD